MSLVGAANPLPIPGTGFCATFPDGFRPTQEFEVQGPDGEVFGLVGSVGGFEKAIEVSELVMDGLGYLPGAPVDTGLELRTTARAHTRKDGRERAMVGGALDHSAKPVAFAAGGAWDWRATLASLEPCFGDVDPRYDWPLERSWRPGRLDPLEGGWFGNGRFRFLSLSVRPEAPRMATGELVDVGPWSGLRKRGRRGADWYLERDGIHVQIHCWGCRSRHLAAVERAIEELEVRGPVQAFRP